MEALVEKERSSHGFGRNCVRENGGEMKKNRRYIERERERRVTSQ